MNQPTKKYLPLVASLFLAGPVLIAQESQDGVSGYPENADISEEAGSSNLSAFVTTVTDAFNDDTGSTQAFEFNPAPTGFFNAFGTGFGVDRSLSIESDVAIQTVSSSGSFEPLGTFGITSNNDQSSIELTFDEITENGTPLTGEGVTHIGFTILPRDNSAYPLDIEAEVVFDDASTDSLSATIGNIPVPASPEYTFYEFEAAPGRTIDTLTLSALDSSTGNPVDTRIGIDNLGFVTSIPEPSSFAFLGGICVFAAGLLRRPRHS